MKSGECKSGAKMEAGKKDIGEKGKGGGHQVNGVANMVSQEYKR